MPSETKLSPSEQLLQMASGYVIARCLYCAAKLNVADLLSEGPRSTSELAAATHTHPDALYRLLRALAMHGIFTEITPRVFALSPLAQVLRNDAPDSIRAMILFLGDPMHQAVYAQLEYSLRTGQRAFDQVFGQPPFEYLASHPEEAAVFQRAMTSYSLGQVPVLAEAYDFGSFERIVDVGGGHGHLLAGILHRYAQPQGILFDLPATIEQAKAEALLPSDRCQLVAGSFFEAVPAADAHVLKHIIHDWEDEPAIQILANCRRSLSPNGKLLVLEMIVPPMNEPAFAKQLDIEMLLIPGGRERTEEEFRTLYARAGFELTRIVPTPAPVAILEGRPV